MRAPRPIPWTRLLATLALASLVGCGDGGDTDDPADRVTFKVMTRNLYLGADLVQIIFVATPAEIPAKAAEFWETVQASDIDARAKLLAAEIAAERPELVALQEVEWFRTQTPSNFDLANPAPPDAADSRFDFLALLTTELETTHGLTYQAAVNTLSDAELPAGRDPNAVQDLRMTDRDVILVREGVTFENPRAAQFAAHLPLQVGGMLSGMGGVPIKLLRGWNSVDVTLDGARFTFVNSHLEVGGPAALQQEAQANELIAALDGLPGNLVVAGDFNSPSDNTGTASYGRLARKLTDTWPRLMNPPPGLTCCSDLTSATFEARTRIDLVLTRGPFRTVAGTTTGTTTKTPSGRWPSDHAGVVVTLSIPKPR